MSRARQGSLILVLLILGLLLVLCLGYLARQPGTGGAASQTLLESQARALALSGTEDVRCKFMLDYAFPEMALGQDQLVYTDVVSDLSGQRIGCYRITIDQRWSKPPYSIYRIRSEGLLGSLDKPTAVYLISAAFDVSPGNRGPGPTHRFWQYTEWSEGSK